MDDRSFVTAQDFILDVKRFWTTEIYPTLKADFENRAASLENTPNTTEEIELLIGGTTLHRFYAWLERHLQRLKYSGRYGLYPYHDGRRGEFMTSVDGIKNNADRLALDPNLTLPDYYRKVDIHQHPGGVWSDEIAGFVYERGARSTTPLMGKAHKDLHQRFTDFIASKGTTPSHILDMGCGFGKSTRPFFETFKDAHVEAIDLSAPCLTVGAHEVGSRAENSLRYRQMDALKTDYGDSTFDLVTSTMLVHELPPAEIDQLFGETVRIIAPGGIMAHLDFHHLPNAFARFIHDGHARRNNEPFMSSWADIDPIALMTEKGLINLQIIPFQEAEGVDPENNPYWRFPWTIVYGEKPSAQP